MRAFFVVMVMLACAKTAHAQEPEDPEIVARREEAQRADLVTNLHIGVLRLAAGAQIEGGSPLGAVAGFHLSGGFDGVTNEVRGASLRAVSLDVAWNQGGGTALIAPSLLRVDHLMLGAAAGSICVANFLTVTPGTICDPESGYVGLGGSLVSYQYDTSSTRSILRLGELWLALTPLPAFDRGWSSLRFPLLLGASIDYAWSLRTDPSLASDRWIGRAIVAIDAVFRFAFRFEIAARIAYRPSFTEWVDDWGLEASVRLAYLDVQTLLRASGDLYRLTLEVGYAHWSIPSRAFGAPWSDRATDGGFVRLGIEPVARNIP